MIYTVQHILRLCGRRSVFHTKRFNHVRATNGDELIQNTDSPARTKDFNALLQNYKEKITFNSYLEHEKLELGYFKYYLKTIKKAKKIQEKEFHDKSLSPLPVALQYYVEKDKLLNEEMDENVPEPEKAFQRPLAMTTRVVINKNETEQAENPSDLESNFDKSNLDRWMTNYEHFDDSKLDGGGVGEWGKYYGTPDPRVAVSRVGCGGCGALLHCSDPAIPGYLPSEIFKHRRDNQLKTMECQRCHFLKEYNIALDVSVQPEEYEKLLQSIK